MTRWHLISATAGLVVGFFSCVAWGAWLAYNAAIKPLDRPPYESWPHG